MIDKEIKKWRPGILSPRQLKILTENGFICNSKDATIEDAALDLHLSDNGWVMKGSIKLKNNESFSSIISKGCFCGDPIDLKGPITLSPNQTYVVQLRETIDPKINGYAICGQATGKSSIGRLDVLTRLIVDGCARYDQLPLDHFGTLYVEVTPITFPIIVKEGVSLNQLRFFRGNMELSLLDQEKLRIYDDLLVTSQNKGIDILSLNLSPCYIGSNNVIAFRAKRDFPKERPIDLATADKYKIDPKDYWEPIKYSKKDFLEIEKEYFYILRSKEKFKLPSDVGVYCQAITENLGEIRIHYAGFVHPGFGYNTNNGTPLIFEVRGHNVNAFLRDGELLANVLYYKTSELIEFETGDYDNQELKLSKYFDMSVWEQ